MAAFEVQEPMQDTIQKEIVDDRRRIKDECILANKVYDSCRRQNCLTAEELGPARAAEGTDGADATVQMGEPITPPDDAVSVTMSDLQITGIQVLDKHPSAFKPGFCDVSIKFDFCYSLVFRNGRGESSDEVRAINSYNMRLTMFGSTGADYTVGTDMQTSQGEPLLGTPYIWVEAKAMPLDARIYRNGERNEVHVTLGLFSIIKLLRTVHLNVQSRGFCIPEECQDQGDIMPCEYFRELDFPMGIFSPPQRKEFMEQCV